MLKHAIVRNFVRPLISRLGTAAGTLLVAYGFDSPGVEQFINAVIGALLIGVDLLLAGYYRKADVNQAVAEASAQFAFGGSERFRRPGEIFSNE